MKEAYSQLNNTDFYEELKSDPSTDYQKTIKTSLDKLHANSLIDKKHETPSHQVIPNLPDFTFYPKYIRAITPVDR